MRGQLFDVKTDKEKVVKRKKKAKNYPLWFGRTGKRKDYKYH